jgi:hypothetical protein
MTAAILACLCLAPQPLCARLSDRGFRTRESAHRCLAWLGRLAVPQLQAAEADPPDDETRRRCQHLLAPYWVGICHRRTLRWKPLPWTDRDVLYRYLDMPWGALVNYERDAEARTAMSVAYSQGGNYPTYREAARLIVADLLIRRESAARVLHLLGRLAAAEYDWHAKEHDFTHPR